MGGGHMGGAGGAFPTGNRNPGEMGNIESSRRLNPSVRSGLQLAPAGRWWNDKSVAKSLKLRPDQLTRMDNIFTQNRSSLLSSYLGLQQAEDHMAELSKSSNLDEAALYTQIDRVAQARAELEKANTHLQLQLRKEMDSDQLTRLDKQR
jgi:Spy/CpxP family protein refolding chaperone